MKKIFWAPAALALLASCSSPSSKKGVLVSPHFNLEILADNQSAFMSKSSPDVLKKVITNGKIEEKTMKIEDWGKELEIIKKSNLDKPAFIGNYSIDSISVNGVQEKTYFAKKADLSIKYQEITKDSLGNIIHLESASEDQNFLYYSKKEVVADFEVVSGKSILKKYATKAIQKIIGLDTFSLEVDVKIK